MRFNPRFIPYAVFFVSAFLSFIVVEEDAFIYFRIAQNMADGYGIVFNRGGEHIESGSGLIWQLMLAGIATLPVHLVIFAKFLGVLFACLSLWMLLRLSDRFIADKSFVIFPALFLAASTPFYYWSHRGLETAQYVFVLLWLLDWLTDKHKIRFWFVPAFLVFCSRPEGFLMAGATLPWLWLERKSIPSFGRGIFFFVALCGAVIGWRLWYFHDLLPHAFYHKMGVGSEKGMDDFIHYGLWNLLWLWLLMASLVLLFVKQFKRCWVPLLLLFFITAVWGVVGADWKSFNRQLSSWLPFAFLYSVMGIQLLVLTQWRKKALLFLFSLYAAYLVIFCPYTNAQGQIKMGPNFVNTQLFIKAPVSKAKEIISAVMNPDGYFTSDEPVLAGDHIGFNRNATVGRFIQSNYPENITVIFDQMGQAPWYGGLDKVFIDNTGLTDKQIGYYDFTERAGESIVFSRYGKLLMWLKSNLFDERIAYANRDEAAQDLLDKKPELVLARGRYVEKFPDTIIGRVINSRDFKQRYHQAFYINRRDVIYQRNDLPVINKVVIPPGSLVEAY